MRVPPGSEIKIGRHVLQVHLSQPLSPPDKDKGKPETEGETDLGAEYMELLAIAETIKILNDRMLGSPSGLGPLRG